MHRQPDMPENDQEQKGYDMILERLGKELLFFDGGMGTLLQEKGLEPGELPETWNLTHGDEIEEIHRAYIEAGSDIILTNTFGANALKFHDDGFSLEEVVRSAVLHVKNAAEDTEGRSIQLSTSALRESCSSLWGIWDLKRLTKHLKK